MYEGGISMVEWRRPNWLEPSAEIFFHSHQTPETSKVEKAMINLDGDAISSAFGLNHAKAN